jgi:hypothetical protein
VAGPSGDTGQQPGSQTAPPAAADTALATTGDGGDGQVGADAATPPVPAPDGEQVAAAQ